MVNLAADIASLQQKTDYAKMNRLRRKYRSVLFLLLALCRCIILPAAQGQEELGWSGTIRNASYRPAVGAIVQLTDRSGRIRRETVTENGAFHFGGLPRGTYQCSIFYQGKQLPYPQPIAVPFDGIPSFLLTGEGSVLLEAANQQPSRRGALSNESVTAIPLNKRDFSQLLLQAAGTMTDTNGTTNFTQQFAINGQRGVEAVFSIDGASSVDPEMGGATMSNFNVDAVQEIQSQSGWMPAHIGRGAAGFTNVITRSGTDSWHGSLFEFLRNSALDARNFFDRRTPENPERLPPFRRNEFGFTLGGMLPGVGSNTHRTAFFVEYQGFRQVLGTTQVLAVPTAAERRGIDTTAFPGDTLFVPANPTMTALLNHYPLPNDPTGTFGARTYATSSPVVTRADQFSGRLDQDLSAHDKLFARFSWDNLNGPTTNPDQTAIDSTWGINYVDHQRNAELKWSHLSSRNFLAESTISFTRTTPSFPTADHTTPGFVLADNSYEPFDSAAGSVTAAIGNLFEAQQDFRWITGKHTMQWGALFTMNRDTTYFGTATNGQYTFGGGPSYSTTSIASASGLHNISPGQQLPDSLTALLLGSAFSYTIAVAPEQFPQGSQIGVAAVSRYGVHAYWEDTWKVTPRLALDYGLRYELYTPIDERADRSAALSFVNGHQDYLIHPDPRYRTQGNNWAPRLRLNWEAAPHFWIRAGGALTTIPPNIWQDNLLTGSAPYVDYPRLTAAPGAPVLFGTRITPADLPPVFNLAGVNVLSAGNSKKVPANTIWDVNRFEQELAVNTGTTSVTPLNANAISRDFRNARLATWSLGIEDSVHGLNLSAGYIGTAGIGLPALVFPNAYPGATPLFARYTDFNSLGQITGGFGTDMLLTNRSHSTYHALQTSLGGSLGHFGPQVQANYTWSKSLDDTSTVIGPGIGSTSGAVTLPYPQDPFNLAADKGPSTFDVKQALTFTVVQDLHADQAPLLRYAGRKLTQGWQLLNISTLLSGLPFTIYSGVQQTGVGSLGADRPNELSVPLLSTSRTVREDYFGRGAANSSFFTVPVGVIGGTGPNGGVWGTLGRDTFRGPAMANFDFALIKDTLFELGRTHKSVNVQFRAELFNLFNVVNFGLPSNVLTGSGFGVINRTANTSRQIQFSLKAMF